MVRKTFWFRTGSFLYQDDAVRQACNRGTSSITRSELSTHDTVFVEVHVRAQIFDISHNTFLIHFDSDLVGKSMVISMVSIKELAVCPDIYI